MSHKKDKKIHFGKYVGRTFRWIAENDPDYLYWMRKQDWVGEGLLCDINRVLPKINPRDIRVYETKEQRFAQEEIKKMRSMGLEYFIQKQQHENTNISGDTSIHRERSCDLQSASR